MLDWRASAFCCSSRASLFDSPQLQVIETKGASTTYPEGYVLLYSNWQERYNEWLGRGTASQMIARDLQSLLWMTSRLLSPTLSLHLAGTKTSSPKRWPRVWKPDTAEHWAVIGCSDLFWTSKMEHIWGGCWLTLSPLRQPPEMRCWQIHTLQCLQMCVDLASFVARSVAEDDWFDKYLRFSACLTSNLLNFRLAEQK